MIKILALDLDGTLLNSNAQIEESSIKILKKIKDDVKIVLSSGRPFDGLKDFLEELEIDNKDNYSIVNTGTQIMRNDKKIIYQKKMSVDDFKRIKEISDRYDLQTVIFTTDEILTDGKPEKHVAYDAKYIGMQAKKMDEIPQDFTRICIAGEPEVIKKMIKKEDDDLKKDYYTVLNEDFMFEIMKKGTGKGELLEILCEKIGIKKEETMAI